MQNSRNLPHRILPKIYGPFHVFYLNVQYLHEDFLHRFHCPYNLPHAIQETILHRKYLIRYSDPKLCFILDL